MKVKNWSKKFFLALFFLVFYVSLEASQSGSFRLMIKELNSDNKLLYSYKDKISFNNLEISKEFKYKDIVEKILEIAVNYEEEYLKEELYFVENVYDSDGHEWTISVTVTDKNSSVTSFTAKYNDLVISGWINRNEKDIFGTKVLNF